MMLSLEEKKYLLHILQKTGRRAFLRKTPPVHRKLVEKLEQSIRNEETNRGSFGKRL